MADKLKRIFAFKNVLASLFAIGILGQLLCYLTPFVHPASFKFIPLFGLAAPLILLFNFILLIIAVIRRTRWSFVIIGMFILGFKLNFRIYSWGSDSDTTGVDTIKFVSYNVKLFDRYNPSKPESYKTKNKIFQYLKQQNADIYCFQEFYEQDLPTTFHTKDSLIELLQITDYHERFVHKTFGRQNFGVCTLSKYPIIEKGNVLFENQKDNYNFCIYTDIVITTDTIRVYNAHLQSIQFQQDDYALFNIDDPTANDRSSGFFKLLKKIINAYPVRADQAERITEHIRSCPYPVVVCGDFNDTPLSYTYNQFNKQLTDAFRNCGSGLGKTYAGKIPAGRIDYIFHSPQFNSTNFEIQEDILSDHYAIGCQLYKTEQ